MMRCRRLAWALPCLPTPWLGPEKDRRSDCLSSRTIASPVEAFGQQVHEVFGVWDCIPA